MKNWKDEWPPWAFHIAVVDTKLTIGKRDNTPYLKVEVPSDPNCIYNNLGKKFFNWKYVPGWSAYTDLEKKAYDIFSGHDSSQTEQEFDLSKSPLRWSSAGGLGIVTFRKKRWVALFWRDIQPVGWNVANGGSENEEEWTDLAELAGREFIEELIIIEEHMTANTKSCTQIEVNNRLAHAGIRRATTFTEDFRKLRAAEGLEITVAPDRKQKDTTQHDEDGFNIEVNRNGKLYPNPGFIISVNATSQDLGIEAIRLYQIDMDTPSKANYVLDGEIKENGKLCKRPVMFLSLEYLRNLFNNNSGSIGDLVRLLGHESDGCKYFREEITGKSADGSDNYDDCSYVMFDYDAVNREQTDAASCEIKNEFATIAKRDCISNQKYRMMCPVTWKTIESAFQFKYLEWNVRPKTPSNLR